MPLDAADGGSEVDADDEFEGLVVGGEFDGDAVLNYA